MSDDDLRFTAQEYGTLINWMMASDPWPISQTARKRIVDMLNEEAEARGYDDWVQVYHEWGVKGDD